ncbi:MAG: ATPase [Spirochaetales bacterium]|nr:ATPase [Spirochaetales bacterium]
MGAITAIIFAFGVVNVFADDGTTSETSAHTAAAVSPSESVLQAQIKAEVTKFALIGAAIAFGFGAIGAGIAVGNVGSAAMGAIGEKPEIAGQALIFVALAEGLAVFGLIIAILILGNA